MSDDFEQAVEQIALQSGRGNLILANKAIIAALNALNAKIAAAGCGGNCACKTTALPTGPVILSQELAEAWTNPTVTYTVDDRTERKVVHVDAPETVTPEQVGVAVEDIKAESPVKRGRGRPRKNP